MNKYLDLRYDQDRITFSEYSPQHFVRLPQKMNLK